MTKISKVSLLLIGLIGIHLFLLINLQFTAWPEMSSFPYLFSKGFTIYKDFVHPYPPLLTLVLVGIYKMFGYKLIVLKLFTWFLIIINDIFIFRIVKKITKSDVSSFLAISSYVITQPFLDGNMLWFDPALTTPILIAVYFWLGSLEDTSNNTNMVLAGTFLSVALLVKQTTLVYITIFIFLVILFKKNLKYLLVFLSPVVISLTGLFYWLTQNGSLQDFINWNFVYPSKYWTYYPFYVILSLTHRELAILFLVLIPVVLLLLFRFKEVISNKNSIAIYSCLVAAIIAVYPRFSFYHFQTALSFCAIIFGIFVSYFKIRPIFTIFYLLVLFVVISLPVIKIDWGKETRFWSGSDVNLAKIITQKSGEKSIYLMGPHSGLYALSGKVPAKPWLDNFGWYFEIPGVQEETIESWNKNPPSAIFIQDVLPGAWYLIGTYQPKKILLWVTTNYIKREEVASGIWYWELKKK